MILRVGDLRQQIVVHLQRIHRRHPHDTTDHILDVPQIRRKGMLRLRLHFCIVGDRLFVVPLPDGLSALRDGVDLGGAQHHDLFYFLGDRQLEQELVANTALLHLLFRNNGAQIIVHRACKMHHCIDPFLLENPHVCSLIVRRCGIKPIMLLALVVCAGGMIHRNDFMMLFQQSGADLFPDQPAGTCYQNCCHIHPPANPCLCAEAGSFYKYSSLL